MKQHGVSVSDLQAHLDQPTKEAALRELKSKLFHSKEEEEVVSGVPEEHGRTSSRATESAAEAKPKAQAKARTAQAKAK